MGDIFKVGDLVQLNFNDPFRNSAWLSVANSDKHVIVTEAYKGIVFEEARSRGGYEIVRVKFFHTPGVFEFLKEDPKLRLISRS